MTRKHSGTAISPVLACCSCASAAWLLLELVGQLKLSTMTSAPPQYHQVILLSLSIAAHACCPCFLCTAFIKHQQQRGMANCFLLCHTPLRFYFMCCNSLMQDTAFLLLLVCLVPALAISHAPPCCCACLARAYRLEAKCRIACLAIKGKRHSLKLAVLVVHCCFLAGPIP